MSSASTRVADIVALAGTSHGTFYTYFDDKRDALLALTQQAASAIYGAAIAPLARGRQASGREAIRARMAVFFRAYSDWGDVVRTWDPSRGRRAPHTDQELNRRAAPAHPQARARAGTK